MSDDTLIVLLEGPLLLLLLILICADSKLLHHERVLGALGRVNAWLVVCQRGKLVHVQSQSQ